MENTHREENKVQQSYTRQYLNRIVNYIVSCGTFLRSNPDVAIILGVIFAITIGGKYLLLEFIIPETTVSTDFTRIFLYFNDILAIFLLYYCLKTKNWPIKMISPLALWLFFQILVISDPQSISVYYGGRLIFALLLFSVISRFTLNKEKITILAILFSFAGGLQSILGIYQFISKHSLGLSILGESPLNTFTSGVSTVSYHGEKLLRAYGTFSHPNLLAGFLVATTLLNLYLLTKSKQKTTWFLLLGLFALHVVGLLTTLSRTGVFIGVLVIKAYTLMWLFSKFRINIIKALGIKLIVIILIIIFLPYLSARSSFTDNSTQERVLFTEIATESIRDRGFLGLGIGNGVFHMKHYTDEQLKPWEYQPIHNYYLLAMAELGMGALIIFYVIFKVLKTSFQKIKTNLKAGDDSFTWNIALGLIFGSFLFLAFFDHYFFTLWQGQILFWSIAGLIVAKVNLKS